MHKDNLSVPIPSMKDFLIDVVRFSLRNFNMVLGFKRLGMARIKKCSVIESNNEH